MEESNLTLEEALKSVRKVNKWIGTVVGEDMIINEGVIYISNNLKDEKFSFTIQRTITGNGYRYELWGFEYIKSESKRPLSKYFSFPKKTDRYAQEYLRKLFNYIDARNYRQTLVSNRNEPIWT